MTLTTTASSRMRPHRAPGRPVTRSRPLTDLWRSVTSGRGTRRRHSITQPVPQPITHSMPQRFGDHFRWPDGTWTHSG